MFTNNATIARSVCRVTVMSEKSALDIHRERLREQGHNLSEATKSLEQERRIMRDDVLEALAAGVSELEASKLSGVTRDSIRRWQGK